MLVSLPEANKLLESGEVVALPTETVYGLAGRIDHDKAIQKIFSTKQRPFFDPLIVHVNSIEMAKTCVSQWPEFATLLAKTYWPGPLTIVLPKASQISGLITSGLDSVGVRLPRHKVFVDVIDEQKCPLAAPSANKFGRVSPTTAEHVEVEFDQRVPVVDGGPCTVGIESTVVLLRPHEKNFSVLRKGMISETELKQLGATCGYEMTASHSAIESPGHLKHHYMPSIPLILVGGEVKDLKKKIEESLRDLPDSVEGVKLIRPSKIDSIHEMKLPTEPALAARELYTELRNSAQQGSDVIVFKLQPYHKEKSFEAIMERMTKAASLVL